MKQQPNPIPASKMPSSAKCGIGRAVYKGWFWTYQPKGKHWGKTGGVYNPVQPCAEGHEKR